MSISNLKREITVNPNTKAKDHPNRIYIIQSAEDFKTRYGRYTKTQYKERSNNRMYEDDYSTNEEEGMM